jgi:hypothetical protein
LLYLLGSTKSPRWFSSAAPISCPYSTSVTWMLWAYLFLRLHNQGIEVVAIFWGLWLFPFGRLVIRSDFIPAYWASC